MTREYRIKAAIALLEKVTGRKVKLVENEEPDYQQQQFQALYRMLTTDEGDMEYPEDIRLRGERTWEIVIKPYNDEFEERDTFTMEGDYDYETVWAHKQGTESDSEAYPEFTFTLTKITDDVTGVEMDPSLIAALNKSEAFHSWLKRFDDDSFYNQFIEFRSDI